MCTTSNELATALRETLCANEDGSPRVPVHDYESRPADFYLTDAQIQKKVREENHVYGNAEHADYFEDPTHETLQDMAARTAAVKARFSART